MDQFTLKENLLGYLQYGYGTNAILGGVLGALGFFCFVPDPDTSWFTGTFVGAGVGLTKVWLKRRIADYQYDQMTESIFNDGVSSLDAGKDGGQTS